MLMLRQLLSIFLSFCLIYSQVLVNLAYAEGIEADGSTQTTLDRARNGVTVVNIAKPSARGLSHNKFRKYNVNKQGVILNNSNQTAVKTQLGGFIYGNAHLAAGSAKVILNEVTGSSRSHLRGYTEVAGRKADLVLVNPNGISMNGAGFINVPTITFSTGTANLNGGEIDSFSVNRGDITIEGQGLNTQTQRSTYIYTKSLKLNAKIHAQDLNVALGSNDIDYQTRQVTAQSQSSAQQNAVMLDSSALGGMYANRITLVGTDKGLGVNLPPEVLASSGDITITADGKIQLNDLNAKQKVSITSTSGGVAVKGDTYGGDQVNITAKERISLENGSSVAAKNDVTVASNHKDVTLKGNIHGGNKAIVTANETISLSNTAALSADNTVAIVAGQTLANQGTIVAGANASQGTLSIQADTIVNQHTLSAKSHIEINTIAASGNHGTIVAGLNNDGSASYEGTLNVTGGMFTNQGVVATSSLLGDYLTNTNGHITARQIHTKTINNAQGYIGGRDALTIDAQTIDNSNGEISANVIQADTLTNINGNLQSATTLAVTAKTINNNLGTIAADSATINADDVTNRSGVVQGRANTHLTATNLDNTQGEISANSISAHTITNSEGELLSDTDLVINATSLENIRGTIQADDDVEITSETLNNTQGEISATKVAAQAITNTKGKLLSSKKLSITATTINNTQGTIAAKEAAKLDANTLTNRNGTVEGEENVTLTTTHIDNRDGKIEANKTLAVTTQTINLNRSDLYAKQALNLKLKALNNVSSSSIQSGGNLTIEAKDAITNNANLLAASNLSLKTDGNLTNKKTISARNKLNIKANSLTNSGANAKLTGGSGTNTIDIAGTIDNRSRISAQNKLIVKASTLDNRGSIAAGQNLTTHTNNLYNRQTLFSGGDMNLYTTGTLYNYANKNIFALNSMTLARNPGGGKTNQIVNDRATIETYNGDMTIRTKNLQNITGDPTKVSSPPTTSSYTYYSSSGSGPSAKRYTRDYVTTITNESFTGKPAPAKILSGRNLSIDGDTITNKFSLIAANNNVHIKTNHLSNTSVEAYKNEVVISKKYRQECLAGDDDNDRGSWKCTKWGAKKLSFTEPVSNTSTAIDRVSSTIQAGGNLTIIGTTVGNGDRKTGVSLGGRTKQTGNTSNSSVAAKSVSADNAKSVDKTIITDPNGNVSDIKITLPQGDFGLFVYAQDPASNYLIETNPEFVIYENFISSDYMMEHLDIDPAATSKRIGDAFYENRLVRDAIFEKTGRRFLNKNLKNDYDQFKYLMENALQASRSLNLVAGISLTPDQVSSLTTDIVWMEEKIVQGHRVLVPVVYLANSNNYHLSNDSKIIAGENVSLQVASLVNSGDVEAGDSLDIEATDAITNLGGKLHAEGDINLYAKNDIKNISGSIQGENVAIKSEQGNVIHETFTEEGPRTVLGQKTTVGATAKLVAKGNLSIEAGKDITIKGADVAARDTDLTATNVTIETIRDKRTELGPGIVKTQTSVTTHQGSNLNVANLTINADETAKIAGSNIKAQDMAVAAENITIETVQNKTYDREGGRKSSTTTHQGSIIDVANLNLAATERAKIEGSSITAQDTLKIQADQIDILAVNDTTTYERKSSSGNAFKKESKQTKKFTSTSKGSSLNAANMELTTTGSDITIIGSDLTAAEQLVLDSANNITIQAGYDGSFKEKKTSSSGLFQGGEIYSDVEELKGKMTKTAVASHLNATNLTLKSDRELLVEGSNLSAADISGEAQDITIKAAQNVEKTWSKRTEKSIGVGELKDSLTRPDKAGKFKDKKLQLKIADAQYENSDKSVKKTTVASANLEGETISLTAASEEDHSGNILIEGSNLNATETISLTASNDVTIKEAKEVTETKTASQKGSAELTVGVKHQAVEVIKAAEALQMAIKASEQAKAAYDDYKKQLKQTEKQYKTGLIEKEDLDDMREDERFYKASVTLTAASVIAATKNLTSQAIAATQSSGTYGFNAEVQLDIDAIVEKAKDISTRSVGSNVAANRIEIDAGNKALIKGSNLNAREQIAIAANEVEIAASRDTSESSSSTDHAHLTYNYSVYGGSSFNASADFSQNSSKGSTYNNSRLNGKNIAISSREDTYVTGAVVKAEEKLQLDVGGNLKVASLQDRSRSKSASVGASGGTGGSLSANASISKSSRKWVNEQTALLGGDVKINVQNHTELKGAKIAAIDKKGQDNGQLNLTTKTLEYETIRDRDSSNNMSVSGGTEGFGSAGLGFSDSTQITRATIGQGTIQVGNETNPELKNLNRDIDQSVVSIKNTGVQLDVDASTLDVVTSPYDTVEGIVDDSKQIKYLGKAVVDMTETSIKNDSSVKQGLDAIAFGFDVVNGVAVVGRDEEGEQHQQLKTTENATAEELAQLSNELFKASQERIGIAEDETSTILLTSKDGINDETIRDYAAATDEGDKQSYLNVQQTDITSGGDIMGSLWAETSRQKYARNKALMPDGKTRNDKFETGVEEVAVDLAKGTWNDFSGEKATGPITKTVNGKKTTISARDNWYEKNKSSELIAKGNKKLNSVKDKSKVKPREVRLSEAQKLDNLKKAVHARTDLSEEEKHATVYAANALACAKLKCAKGVPEDDANYQLLKSLQEQGEALESQGVELGKMMADHGQTLSEGEFEYDMVDRVQDWKTRNDEALKRASGAMETATGVVGAIGSGTATAVSVPACIATGVACLGTAAGAAGTVLSAGQAVEGYKNMTADYTSTEGQHVLKSFSAGNRDFEDRELVKDTAVDLAVYGVETIALKKVEKVVGIVPDKLEKKVKQKVKDSFSKSSETKADAELPDGKKDQKLLEDLRPEHEKIYPPRTDKAIQESKHVAKEMDKIQIKKTRKVSVVTHEDGTVSVGISGGDGNLKTIAAAKRIEEHLNKQAGYQKYKVSGKSMPTENLKTKREGCDAGQCAEPKVVEAAHNNPSEIDGFDTRSRGGKNNHPRKTSNAGLTPVDNKQMDPCETCADPKNAKEMMDYANYKSE